MKLISGLRMIFWTICITNLVHIAVSKAPYNSRNFEKFLQRLEKVFKDSSQDILPFTVTNNLIEKFNDTSDKFKKLCIDYEAETLRTEGNFSPVSSLDKAIKKVFFDYLKSAGEKWNKVLEIQFVDPVGFISYLTRKHQNANSPNFIESVEQFRRMMISQFDRFRRRLEKVLSDSALSQLPFSLKIHVFEDLKLTSDKFKKLCVQYDGENRMRNGRYSSISSLLKAIKQSFKEYNASAIGFRQLLRNIEKVDPIGLNVYLTKKNVSNSSPIFIKTIKIFEATMNYRIRLWKSKTNNSDIEFFKGNPKKIVHEIPKNVREQITTEYERFQTKTIDFFIEIVMEQRKQMIMYRLSNYKNVENYAPHRSSEIDDVQILYSPNMGPNNESHAVCIYYEAISKNVLVYDCAMYKSLDSNQLEIVERLYPFKKQIIFVKSKTLQGKHRAVGSFAMIYATMLLLKMDPSKVKIRLNEVHGDEALYMRLHILNMFVNRRLTSML